VVGEATKCGDQVSGPAPVTAGALEGTVPALQRDQVVGVGYEGKDIGFFISGLLAARVRLVVDVRLNAISRKTGFSKRALSAELAEAGIGYRHFPELGNPRWNRDGFAGPPGEVSAARARFSRLIGGGTASARIAEIAAAADAGVVAVMCFEADDMRCHRHVVLARVRAGVGGGGTARYHRH
jgi:uncharacterized protein (DUF488 family)